MLSSNVCVCVCVHEHARACPTLLNVRAFFYQAKWVLLCCEHLPECDDYWYLQLWYLLLSQGKSHGVNWTGPCLDPTDHTCNVSAWAWVCLLQHGDDGMFLQDLHHHLLHHQSHLLLLLLHQCHLLPQLQGCYAGSPPVIHLEVKKGDVRQTMQIHIK